MCRGSTASQQVDLYYIPGCCDDDEVIVTGEVADLALDIHVSAATIREVNRRRALFHTVLHAVVVAGIGRRGGR